MIAAADGSDEPRQLAGEFATLEDGACPDGTLVGVIVPGGARATSPSSRPMATRPGRYRSGWQPWDSSGRTTASTCCSPRTRTGPAPVFALRHGRCGHAGELPPWWRRSLNLAPDGTRMAYATLDVPCCDKNGVFKVWVANVDGTNAQRVANSTGDISESSASWSPGGNAFRWRRIRRRVPGVDRVGGRWRLDRPLGPISLSKPIDRSSDPRRAGGHPRGVGARWRVAPGVARVGSGVAVVDATTGAVTQLPWTSTDWPVWQRLAT